MKLGEFTGCFRLTLLLVLAFSACTSRAQKTVRQIEIQPGWGGLGIPQHADVIVCHTKDGFFRGGKRVGTALVLALVDALSAPTIAKPDLDNLGVTTEWLKANLLARKQTLPHKQVALEGTVSQQELFASSFTDIAVMAKIVPNLYSYISFDDNAYVKLQVTFEDGSQITAESYSFYAFMIPWRVGENHTETFNVNISRAVSALLPAKTIEKERLAGEEFASKLADELMRQIEPEWNMRGVEDRAGDSLAALRRVYTVRSADINSYNSEDFGLHWSSKGPFESNLHVTLHKPDHPANLMDQLVLLYDHDRVVGLQHFFDTGEKYDSLVLSVPWLVDYMRQNPKVELYVQHVHETSFGEHAMRTFALDMKARGREELIPVVRAQQADIALVTVGSAYWLVFPDKHMMLWRYELPRDLLKWKPSDFPPGRCGDYESNFGGCSGLTITQDGDLVREKGFRDEDCVASYREKHAIDLPAPDALFSVSDHNESGFIDRTGKIIIPLCFDDAGDFSEGLARFERDGSWGYMDETGTVVIEPRFPSAEDFSEGLARVQVTGSARGYDGRWGFIDKTGKIVVQPDYKWSRSEGDGAEQAFHSGLAKVEVDYKSGYIDQTGKVVIPTQFTYAYPFADGIAAATKSEDGESGWGFIDTSGKWVIPPQFEWANNFSEHLAAVNRHHDCGYIDASGAYALRPPVSPGKIDCVENWGDFSEGLSRWMIGSKYGFIDHTGKMVIQPQFDLTDHFSEGLAAVMVNRKWGYIDNSGMMVIPANDFSNANPFHNGLARVVTNHETYGYINKTGRFVWESKREGTN
jgi:hypothetical protein